jgi:hypothetical protein
MKRCCLPFAATLSSLSTSESSNFAKALTNPVRLASIREGVMDFGRTTHPFLSARRCVSHRFSGQCKRSVWTHATKREAHRQA